MSLINLPEWISAETYELLGPHEDAGPWFVQTFNEHFDMWQTVAECDTREHADNVRRRGYVNGRVRSQEQLEQEWANEYA